MSRPVRIIVIAIVLVAALVTGIAFFTASYEPKQPERGLYVNNTRVKNPGPFLTINGEALSFDDFRYYYLTNKAYTETMYGADYWDLDYDHAKAMALRDATLNSIMQLYAWVQVAEEDGVTLTDEEKAAIRTVIAELKEQLGEDGFQKGLRSQFYTDEAMYIRITEMRRLTEKTQNLYREQLTEEATDGATDGYASAKHILIAFDEAAEDPDADEAAALELATGLVTQLREAEANEAVSSGSEEPAVVIGENPNLPAVPLEEEAADSSSAATDPLEALPGAEEDLAPVSAVEALFDELVETYGQDPGMESDPSGYTFGPEEMVDEFYDATMALEVGEISDPVRSDYGYHIIMRLPLDEEYVQSNITNIIDTRVTQLAEERITAIREGMDVVQSETFKALEPNSIR